MVLVGERDGFRAWACNLEGVRVIEPTVRGDSRGWFQETYRASTFAEFGIDDDFVQWNHSRSAAGVLRGLHFQTHPSPQAKLIRCARGRVFDVVVDIRRGSPTFGQWRGWELDDKRGWQLYCPVGFAHGFQVLSDVADLTYACSDYYVQECDRAILATDAEIGVDWPLPTSQMSDRDRSASPLRDATGLPSL